MNKVRRFTIGVGVIGLSLTAVPRLFALITGQAADVVVGQANMTSISPNQGGAAAANTVNRPYYVCRNGNHLFVTDHWNHRVLIYNTVPTSNNAAADVVIGQPNLTSNTANNGGLAGNTLYRPISAFSTGTYLFIADAFNNRVLIYNTIPGSNFATANVVLGQPDANTNAANYGGISETSLYWPHYVYSDGVKLYISDTRNHRVLIYNSIPTADHAPADMVVGQPNANTNTAGTSAATMNYPLGLCTVGNRLLVSEYYNNRLLIFFPLPTSTGAAASLVVGQPNMTSNTANQPSGTVSAHGLKGPYGCTTDGTRLYLADLDNYRVLIFNSIPTVDGADADTVIGQPNFYTAVSGSPSAVQLQSPDGIHYSGTQLLVSEYDHRVLIFNEPTATATPSRTSTATPTASPTRTRTPTHSPTCTISATVTVTPTVTPTGTITQTATRTATVLPTQTATARAPEISGDVIAYPAPARGGSVWFYYRTAGPARVTVEIYNAAGERAAALADEAAEGGNHRLCWDIREIAPGVYVYRLKTASAAGEHAGEWRKLAIVK